MIGIVDCKLGVSCTLIHNEGGYHASLIWHSSAHNSRAIIIKASGTMQESWKGNIAWLPLPSHTHATKVPRAWSPLPPLTWSRCLVSTRSIHVRQHQAQSRELSLSVIPQSHANSHWLSYHHRRRRRRLVHANANSRGGRVLLFLVSLPCLPPSHPISLDIILPANQANTSNP